MSPPTHAPAGRRRFWVTVCLFALANINTWIVYDRWIRPRTDLLHVEQFSPPTGATVGERPTFSWRFNLDVTDTIATESPGTFSPPLAGKWRWSDPRTLTFTPESNLPKATRFTVMLSPERLRAAQGFHLSKSFVSTVHTAPLALSSVHQIGFEGDYRPIIEMRFNDNVNSSEVIKALSLTGPEGKPLSCQLYGNSEGDLVRIVTDSLPLLRDARQDQSVTVHLAAGLAGTSGPLGLTKFVEQGVLVSQALFATELMADAPARGDPSLNLRFNGDISADVLRPLISIEPAVPIQIEPRYHGVQLVGKFQPATRYAVTIAKSSKESDPQKYPRGDTLSVFVPDCPPTVWFEHEEGYLGSQGNRTLLAHAVNVNDVRVSVTSVYDNNLVAWRNADDRSSAPTQSLTDSFARPVASRKLHLAGKKNQTQDLRISLEELLPPDAARDGVYRVQLAADESKKSRPHEEEEEFDDERADNSAAALVTLSDVGLCAKRTREGVIAWAVSLSTAKPLAGVRVRAFSDKNQPLGSATTDGNGLATIPAINPAPGENCAVLIADRASNDLTWLDLRNSEITFTDSDTSGAAYLRTGHEAFVFPDRGVYRPGEIVHLRAIVRGPDNTTPQPFPMRWKILRPDLRNWNSTISKLDQSGGASWDLALPDDLSTGRWTARIGLPGDEKFFGSVTFQVEEFLPDRLKVDLKIANGAEADALPRLRLADKQFATIQGDWLFGKPAESLQTHVVARMDPAPFAPPSMSGWTFGDTANVAEVLGEAKPLGHRLEIETPELDKTGSAKAPLDLSAILAAAPEKPESGRAAKSTEETYTGPWRLTVTASVLEPGGRAVSATHQADVDVVDRYVGIQRPQLAPKPGETTLFPVALVSANGKCVASDTSLDVTLYRDTWNSTLIYRDGHYRYESSRKLEPVGKPMVVRLDSGRGEIPVAPSIGGAYVLRVCDGKHGAETTLAFLATSFGWDDNISRENPEKLELSLLQAPSLEQTLRDSEPEFLRQLRRDTGLRPVQEPLNRGKSELSEPSATSHGQEAYVTGDFFPVGSIAQVLVRSPFAGRLLLSIETDNVIHTQVIDMPTSHLLVPIAIDPACRPNAYVTATVVRAIDPNAAWRVHRAIGVTRLKIDNADRRLNVAINAPTEIRPNQTLRVQMRVLDSSSKPVANASINVAAVDEGICQLTNFKTPDPFGFFYAPRALGVTSADLYSQLMPEVARPDKASAVGGDGGDAEESRHRTPVSAKRVKPVALVSGVVHTDENGFASADFPVPQFIGKLRVMAVAHADTNFGSADTATLVRSPLLVQSSWPRFVAPGDAFSVTLSAFNNTAIAGQVSTTAEILDEHARLSFGSTKSTKVELEPASIVANGQTNQTLNVVADNSAGVAHVRVVATMGSESFEETVEIPIRPASPTITTGGYAVATPDKPLPITLPKEMLAGTTSYEIRVTPWPALELPEGLDYLERYPYGCAEQTTSTLFPLVYLSDIGQQIAPGVFTKERVDEKVQCGMIRLLGMQTADGGIAMWPGGRSAWPWASVYVAHFVVEAEAAGHKVPEDLRTRLLAYVRRLLNKSTDEVDELETQAYATYVLALAGKPDRAAMDRLGEIVNRSKDSCAQARFHLAAAWVATGRRDRAGGLIPATLPPMRSTRQLSGNLGSGVRERAILLSALLAADPDRADLPAVAQQLADAGKNGQWRSTQDTAFAVMALGRYLRQAKPAAPYENAELKCGETSVASVAQGGSLEWNAPTSAEPPTVSITGPTGAKAYVSWLATGVPMTAPADADNGLRIRRQFLGERGKPINNNAVHSGDLVQVELTLESSSALSNVVIEDLLPSGLEIENPRLETTAKDATANPSDKPPIFQTERVDMRDDRMIVIGDLIGGVGVGKYVYTCRAVTPGVFALPPVRAECMYDLGTSSIAGAGTFTVIGGAQVPIANIGKD